MAKTYSNFAGSEFAEYQRLHLEFNLESQNEGALTSTFSYLAYIQGHSGGSGSSNDGNYTISGAFSQSKSNQSWSWTSTKKQIIAQGTFNKTHNGSGVLANQTLTVYANYASTRSATVSLTLSVSDIKVAPTGSRYDKIKVFNGTQWVKPNRMYVYNGTNWEDFGAPDSSNQQKGYVFNGTTWVKITKEKTSTTTYDTATDKFVNYTGTSTALSLTSGTLTVSTRRHYAAWSAYLRGMMSTTTGNWWSGTSAGNDGTEDWHTFAWSGNRWIQKLVYRSPQSTYYQGCPHVCSARFYSGSWSAAQTYSTNKYTAQNQWNNGWTFNKQGNYTQLEVKYYNNSSYKGDTVSTRIGQYQLYTGTISSVTVWQ